MDRDSIVTRARDYIARESEPTFKKEVEDLLKAEDWKELEDRFYRDLEFGTGGLRGRDRRRLQPDEPASWSPGLPRASATT